jgi:hypothetical protein
LRTNAGLESKIHKSLFPPFLMGIFAIPYRVFGFYSPLV